MALMHAVSGPSAGLAAARDQFAPETTYLNTATYGLPPRDALDAMDSASEDWRHGRCGFDGWDASVHAARAAWARMHAVPESDVAVGAVVSPFAGLVAASLPAGARVLAASEDFTSLLFPLLAQQARGVSVRLVALADLPAAIDRRTDLVAVSAVQSCDGRVADLDALAAAAAHHGARTLIDATQASGWLPLDATRFDYLISGGYKWLLGPRGTAFMAVRPEAAERLTAHACGWYAADDPMAALYGGPLRLAPDARRFDLSPAWLSWVGHAPALALLERVGIPAVHAHDLALANRFRAGLHLPPGDSAIVSVDLAADAADRLWRAGVLASARDGRVRFSFHLYTTPADVDRALEVLAGVMSATSRRRR